MFHWEAGHRMNWPRSIVYLMVNRFCQRKSRRKRRSMIRGLASRCLESASRRKRAQCASLWRDSRRSFAERRRRSGDGRKRDIFEERSAANQEEYFRKETARQLKEIRERGVKRKAERDTGAEKDKRRKDEASEGEEVAETSASSPDA